MILRENKIRLDVLMDVNQERDRQNRKWGKQEHSFPVWYSILGEEFGEVGQAIQKIAGLKSFKETDADDLYMELIHLAAVSVAMAEQVSEGK